MDIPHGSNVRTVTLTSASRGENMNDNDKMFVELLKLKAFLVGEANRHSLAVNTQDVLKMVNSILEKKNEA